MRRIGRTMVVGLLAGLLALPAYANSFQEAVDAAGRGEFAKAVALWRPLAEEGDARAQTYMGLMYDNGWGVPQDQAAAYRWFSRAAAAGHAAGRYHLAFAYHNGRGVQRSQTEALKWYRLAAEQGDSAAQYNLGKIYAHGLVVRRDLVEAHKWLTLAASKPSPMRMLAGRDRDLVAERLTAEQLEEAAARVKAWQPS